MCQFIIDKVFRLGGQAKEVTVTIENALVVTFTRFSSGKFRATRKILDGHQGQGYENLPLSAQLMHQIRGIFGESRKPKGKEEK